MAGRPPYGQPDPRNPFSNQMPSPYSQPSRQYSSESLASDTYSSRNASSVPLNGPQGYGQYGPPCECPYSLPRSLRFVRDMCFETLALVRLQRDVSCLA